jgi:hypothetical protein
VNKSRTNSQPVNCPEFARGTCSRSRDCFVPLRALHNDNVDLSAVISTEAQQSRWPCGVIKSEAPQSGYTQVQCFSGRVIADFGTERARPQFTWSFTWPSTFIGGASMMLRKMSFATV